MKTLKTAIRKTTAIFMAIIFLLITPTNVNAETITIETSPILKANIESFSMYDQYGREIKIKAGTTVEMELANNITSSNLMIGSEIDFSVIRDVKAEGEVVISRGSKALGRVTYIEKRKNFGRPGKIEVKVDKVLTVSGDYIYLDGKGVSAEGKNKSTASWTYFIISLIILWPLIFIPFIQKGGHALIPAGTKFRGTISQSTTIEIQ